MRDGAGCVLPYVGCVQRFEEHLQGHHHPGDGRPGCVPQVLAGECGGGAGRPEEAQQQRPAVVATQRETATRAAEGPAARLLEGPLPRTARQGKAALPLLQGLPIRERHRRRQHTIHQAHSQTAHQREEARLRVHTEHRPPRAMG